MTMKLNSTKAAVLVSAAALALVIGCATQREVEDIVARANFASIAPEIGLAAEPSGRPGAPAPDWPAASARIEQFIAAHPDNPATIAALRLRQATLLLQNKQWHLASNSFAQAERKHLHSARDRAINDLSGSFLWWYAVAGSPEGIEVNEGTNALARISRQWSGLKDPRDEGVRDFLGAMRAWIGLRMANDARGGDAVNFFTNSLNTYSAMLPAGETATWLTGTNWPPGNIKPETATSGAWRRRFRVEDVLAAARTAMQRNNIQPPLAVTNSYFRSRLGLP